MRPDGAFAQLVRGVDTTNNMRHDLHPAGLAIASMSLSADFNLIALKDTYDYIWH